MKLYVTKALQTSLAAHIRDRKIECHIDMKKKRCKYNAM